MQVNKKRRIRDAILDELDLVLLKEGMKLAALHRALENHGLVYHNMLNYHNGKYPLPDTYKRIYRSWIDQHYASKTQENEKTNKVEESEIIYKTNKPQAQHNAESDPENNAPILPESPSSGTSPDPSATTDTNISAAELLQAFQESIKMHNTTMAAFRETNSLTKDLLKQYQELFKMLIDQNASQLALQAQNGEILKNVREIRAEVKGGQAYIVTRDTQRLSKTKEDEPAVFNKLMSIWRLAADQHLP